MNEAEQSMQRGYTYMRDVYRNVARMLLSADPIMVDRRFNFAGNDWRAVDSNFATTLQLSRNATDTWLPTRVIRQYVNFDDDNDVVTLAAILFANDGENPAVPSAVASRVWFENTGTNDPYWIGVMHVWDALRPPIDGTVRVLGDRLEASGLSDANRDIFNRLVRGRRLISVGVPLTEVTNTDELVSRIISPLLEHPWPLEKP